ncbi:cupin-like domain-containing protein [Pedobacter jamesrossensis]|uniref:Cupin-like domain-containing protein n=1 Tax=Pedobacter jamesrossensis TaxID=1908238 RepID=A0ABV8NKL3_9SPHI
MSHFTKVEKKDDISYQEFVDEHLKKRIPVVFKNATLAWESNTIFTPDFFSKNFGNQTTTSGGINYTMNEILEITKNSTPENPAPYPILFEIPKQLPDLLKYLDPIHINYSRPNWFASKNFPYGKYGKNIQLFIGGKGNQYSLHKDFFHTNAWITQLYGQKKFVVFPHGQDDYLYAGEKGFDSFLSPINILNPDLEKYPDYKKATPLEIILEPGETIFIPNGVWHTTVGMGHNISLIFDQLNARNFDDWTKDIYTIKKDQGLLKSNMHYAFAKSAGILCKIREVFGERF